MNEKLDIKHACQLSFFYITLTHCNYTKVNHCKGLYKMQDLIAISYVFTIPNSANEIIFKNNEKNLRYYSALLSLQIGQPFNKSATMRLRMFVHYM